MAWLLSTVHAPDDPPGFERVTTSLTPPPLTNHGAYIISLNRFVKWLGQQVESAGIDLFSGFAAA